MSDGAAVWRLIERHRRMVLARDRQTLRELTRRWVQVERALRDQMIATSEEAARAMAVTGMSPMELRLRAESLQRQLFAQINSYGEAVDGIVTEAQKDMIRMAGANFEQELAAMHALSGYFHVLPVETFEAMVGHVANGSPLYQYFLSGGLANQTMDAIADELVRGIGLGMNPRAVARRMMRAAGLPHQRALVIARSEQMRVWRVATLQNYRESDIVQGWIWLASKSNRTCMACLAKDGSRHELDEEFNDHPNGRCTSIPYVPGMDIKFQTGREWFAQQPESVQREMLGPGRFAAWRGHQISFDDLAHAHHHPVFGTHYSEASLEQALQNAASRRAYAGA